MRTDHIGNPWKGLASYTYQDADSFYGRDQELRDIVGVVKKNAFTTLYGISGAGKTSIINAGLIPLLDKQSFLPIYIRLDHNAGHIPYDAQIINAVDGAINRVGGEIENIIGQNIDSEFDKLWLYFHSHNFWSKDNHIITPIIFIDQFEEIFTKNDDAENIWTFFNVIDSLQYSMPTERILNTIENSDKFISFIEEQNFRMVFSMREDFLARLEDYSYNIPALRKNRIGLKPLNGLQALDVILSPRPDIVSRNVALHIISKIVGRKVTDNVRRLEATSVDTSMLSLFCTELYNYAMEDRKEEITIQLVDLYGENILEWFYDRNMQILPKQIYVYLENQLLTHSGFRNNVSLDDLLQNGILQEQLDILAENRIIRIEDINHNMRVEFTHDVLCKIAKKRKDARDKIARMKGEESALRAFTIDNVIMFVTFALSVLAVYYEGFGKTHLFLLMSFPLLSFFYALFIGRSIADCNFSKIAGSVVVGCIIEVLLFSLYNEFATSWGRQLGLSTEMVDYWSVFICSFVPIALLLFPYAMLIKTTLQHRVHFLTNNRGFITCCILFVLLQSALLATSSFVCSQVSDLYLLGPLLLPSILLTFFPVYTLYRNIKEKESCVLSIYTLINSFCIVSAIALFILGVSGYVELKATDSSSVSSAFVWGGIGILSTFYMIQYVKMPKQQNIMEYYRGVLNFQVFTKYKSFKTRLCTIIICFVIFISGVVATRYWDIVPFFTLPLVCVLALHVACSEFKTTTIKSAFTPKIVIPIILLTEVIVGCQYVIGGHKILAIYASALAITVLTFIHLMKKEQIRKRHLFVLRVVVFSIAIGFVLPIIVLGYNVFNPSLAPVCRVWDGTIRSRNVSRLYFMMIENEQGDKGVMDYSEILLEPNYKHIYDFRIMYKIYRSIYPIRSLLQDQLVVGDNDRYSDWTPYQKQSGFMEFLVIDKNNKTVNLDSSYMLMSPNKYGKSHVYIWLSGYGYSNVSYCEILNENNQCITEAERKIALIKAISNNLYITNPDRTYRNRNISAEFYGTESNVEKIYIKCFEEATLNPILENVDSLKFEDVLKGLMASDYLFAFDKTHQLETIFLDSLWHKLPIRSLNSRSLTARESDIMANKAYLYLVAGNDDKAIISAQSAMEYEVNQDALITLCIAMSGKDDNTEWSDVFNALNLKEGTIEIDTDVFYDQLRERIKRLEMYGYKVDKEKLLSLVKSLFECKVVEVKPELLQKKVSMNKLPNDSVIKEFIDNVSFNMIRVDGGTFEMGSKDYKNDEQPVHTVVLDDYYIGETEVTQELWEMVMNENPSTFIGKEHPVEHVSWEDCHLFITKLNERTGKKFRLPTEAEWEFAARGGNKSEGYVYSGSDSLECIAWYEDNENKTTHPVKQKLPNELGLYDMTGNVWEWCFDYYDYYHYLKYPAFNPVNKDSGYNLDEIVSVYRGGSWGSSATKCRVTNRNKSYCDLRNHGIGFRLAM